MSFDIDKQIQHWIDELNYKSDKVIKTKPIVEERISKIINDNIKTLYKKWKQLVYSDDYGNLFYDRFYDEVNYFINNVMLHDEVLADYDNNAADYNLILSNLKSDIQIFGKTIEFTSENVESFFDMHENICNMVVSEIVQYEQELIENNLDLDIENVSPVEFEHFCANILIKNGWDARLTTCTGDQGVDLIATNGTTKAVFQCKKYSQPVGNGAVQEIIAGKQFEQADFAAVVTSSSYTKSAKNLAKMASIYLLHYSELGQFAKGLNCNDDRQINTIGQQVKAEGETLPVMCPKCEFVNKIKFESLPIKGKSCELQCPKCFLFMDMKMQDEDYSCQGCGVNFNNFKDKMDHQITCDTLRQRIFTCKECDNVNVMDESEFNKLNDKGFVNVRCNCGFAADVKKQQ